MPPSSPLNRRPGSAEFVSVVFFLAIAIVAVTLVLNVAMPRIESMEDTGAIENSIDQLTQLDATIQDVASEGRYSSRTVGLRFQRGTFGFDSADNTVYYELDTDSGIISTHASQMFGPVRVSANADVTVENTTITGIDCTLLTSNYLEACIRHVYPQFDADRHPDLVGYWRMNEGAGQWANDSSRYGNHGTRGASTVSGSDDPDRVTGIHAEGLDFDGDDDYVNASDGDELNITDDVTLSAWIKIDENTGSFLVSREGADTDWVYGLYKPQSNGGVSLYLRDTADNEHVLGSGTDNPVNDSAWHHVAGTFNGTAMTLYLDGDQITQDTFGTETRLQHAQGSPANYIGAWYQYDGTPSTVNGTIDEVRIYNRSLTGEEVRWLAQQRGNNRFINTSELLVHLENTVTGRTLNGTLYTEINGDAATRAGNGSTTVERYGDYNGQGRVTATVDTGSDTYDVAYSLVSGADFLTVEADGDSVSTATHGLQFVLEDTADTVYVDGGQPGTGVYTGNDIDFGAVVAETGGFICGLVGETFSSVGYSTGTDRYELNLTADPDTRVMLPFTQDTYQAVTERQSLITSYNFLSKPSPNFAYGLADEKTVRAALNYDGINLTGPSRTVAPGTYSAVIRHNGVSHGQAQVNVSFQ